MMVEEDLLRWLKSKRIELLLQHMHSGDILHAPNNYEENVVKRMSLAAIQTISVLII